MAVSSTAIPEPPALQIRQAGKRYPGGVTALDAVDLELSPGQLTALVGGNGAGKTTLLKLIAGHLRPDSGSVTVFGRDPSRAGQCLRRDLASVSQSPALDPEMTVEETLKFFAILYELPSTRLRLAIADATRCFGLESILMRRVSACSGGMRQRLHLAASMLHSPRLLLLDEPTNNLDTDGRVLLWNLLRQKTRDGIAVLLSTHDLGAVERDADRVLVMHQGRVLADATPRELTQHHGLPLLSLRFTQSRVDASTLQKSMRLLGISGEVVMRQGEAVIVFSGEPAEEARILAQLASDGMVAATATRHAPDLTSACWALTKDWADRAGGISPTTESARRHGQGRGRKHA